MSLDKQIFRKTKCKRNDHVYPVSVNEGDIIRKPVPHPL